MTDIELLNRATRFFGSDDADSFLLYVDLRIGEPSGISRWAIVGNNKYVYTAQGFWQFEPEGLWLHDSSLEFEQNYFETPEAAFRVIETAKQDWHDDDKWLPQATP